MQVQIGITLDASPALLEVLSNIAASIAADSTITRAARTPRATKNALAEAPGKSAPAVADTLPAEPTSSSAKGSGNAAAAEPPAEAPGKPASSADAPSTSPAASSATTASPSDAKPDIAAVRAILGKLALKDKAQALALLAEHKSASVSALPTTAYAAVIAAATAALAA